PHSAATPLVPPCEPPVAGDRVAGHAESPFAVAPAVTLPSVARPLSSMQLVVRHPFGPTLVHPCALPPTDPTCTRETTRAPPILRSQAPAAAPLDIFVRTPSRHGVVQVKARTAGEVKVAVHGRTGIPPGQQRLLFAGWQLA